jgi:hypothetical protein
MPDTAAALSADDYLWFVDLALDQMVDILRELGDEGANQRPDLPGANTPFALVTHSLGVMEFWGGRSVSGREIQRDRGSEFRASGSVEDLVVDVAAARQRLESDLNDVDPSAAPTDNREGKDAEVPYGRTKGAVLVHVLEELFQHLGHLEITRDLYLYRDRTEGDR